MVALQVTALRAGKESRWHSCREKGGCEQKSVPGSWSFRHKIHVCTRTHMHTPSCCDSSPYSGSQFGVSSHGSGHPGCSLAHHRCPQSLYLSSQLQHHLRGPGPATRGSIQLSLLLSREHLPLAPCPERLVQAQGLLRGWTPVGALEWGALPDCLDLPTPGAPLIPPLTQAAGHKPWRCLTRQGQPAPPPFATPALARSPVGGQDSSCDDHREISCFEGSGGLVSTQTDSDSGTGRGRWHQGPVLSAHTARMGREVSCMVQRDQGWCGTVAKWVWH